MKVAVCINSALSLQSGSLEQVKQSYFEEQTSGRYMIEPSSVAAIQLASSLCGREDQLTAVSIGGEASEAALEYALAYGIDSVVHIDKIPGLNGEDSTVTASILSNWFKKQSFDLIVCGNAGGTGTLPALLASQLDIPCIPRVDFVQKKVGETLEVRQRLLKGWRQVLSVNLPALISVQAGYFSIKYVSVKRRNWASQNWNQVKMVKPEWDGNPGSKVISVDTLKPRTKRTAIDSSKSAADRLKFLRGGGSAQPAKGGGKEDEKKIVDAPPAEAAREIIEFLKKKELLPEKLL